MTKRLTLTLFLTGLISGLSFTAQAAIPTKATESPKNSLTDNQLDSLRRNNPFFLQEVVVQGFKETADYRLAPVSSSSISNKLIQEEAVHSIKEITGLVPNLYMPDYGAKVSSPLYIRGVGSKINSPSVGLYIDGVPYFESAAFDFNFSGIQRIDVLRGPQGTLYGRNTMGGIVNVYTKSPLNYQGTDIEFTGAKNNLYDISATHYFKIKEGMGLSVSGNYNHFDGNFENVTLHKKADGSDAALGRVRFDWEINPRWAMRIITSYDYLNQGGYPFGVYNIDEDKVDPVNYNRESTYKRNISTTGANIEYTGKGYSINSQTSLQYLWDSQAIDQDFSPSDLFFVTRKDRHLMLSEELNIKSTTPHNYQWLFGIFTFYQNTDRKLNVNKIPDSSLDNKDFDLPTYGFAAFHQSTLNNIIWDGLSLTAGVRFDYEHAKNDFTQHLFKNDIEAGNNSFSDKLSFNQVTPKLALQYSTTNEQNFYGSITRGYKAGGFNTSFDKKDQTTFNPEYSWNYEVGTKLGFFDQRLTADLSLFYIDWRHQQVYQPLASGTGRGLTNIGRSASKGVEISIAANPIEALSLQANYGYTKAYYKDYIYNDKISYSGNRLPLVPDHTVSAHADYRFIKPFNGVDEIKLGVTYLGTGKIYWADNNKQSQSYYGLWNATASVRRNNITISLWTKNLMNKDYIAYSVQTSSLYAQKGKPFMIGGTLRIKI